MRLIDADEIKKKSYYAYPSIDHLCLSSSVVDVSDIDNSPTIEAEPVRHGHWDWYINLKHPKCSSCKKESKVVSNYCPACGAKMDEVVE